MQQVIINEEEYKQIMKTLLQEGPFKELKKKPTKQNYQTDK